MGWEAFQKIMVCIMADFSTDIIETQRQWNDILKVLEEKNSTRMLYPIKRKNNLTKDIIIHKPWFYCFETKKNGLSLGTYCYGK